MTGLTRYVRILRMFDERHGEWTISDIAEMLALPTSTVYRTVREMISAGLLEAAHEAHYRLGCCFIEFDRVIRDTDPLYKAGLPLLQDVVMQARVPCAATISRLYNDEVMCIADAKSVEGQVHSGYKRGLPRPLMRGATSKAILAHMPARRLARLIQREVADRSAGATTMSLADLRQELQAIRRRGFSITYGEIDAGYVGIASPISIPSIGILASLSLVIRRTGDDALERRLAMLTTSSANLLTEQLTKSSGISANLISDRSLGSIAV